MTLLASCVFSWAELCIPLHFQDELGSFTAIYGVEITEVELSDVKIIKVCQKSACKRGYVSWNK